MGKPAARLTDPTAHGGLIVGPGVPTVFIGKLPAATMGDNHLCPMMTPGVPPIPHVGGPILLGSTGVFIGGKPAARMGDMAVCVGPPSTVIMGCPTVLIGEIGSGSQAGSAGAAAAAALASLGAPKDVSAIKLKTEESSSQEEHQIDLSFMDSAGKPLSGTPFLLNDPEGAEILAASDMEGGFRIGGYKKKGSFEVAVLSLAEATWTGSAKDGQELTMKCKAPNSKDGTDAMFQLDALTESGQIFTLGIVPAKVRGEALEAKWKYQDLQLEPVCKQTNCQVKSLQFMVVSGALAAVSPTLELQAGKGSYGSAVRAKLDGAWFQEDSDLILPEKVAQFRPIAAYLAKHGGLKWNLVVGKAGPKGEAPPNAMLAFKRGQILASILVGYRDLIMNKFGIREWTDKEAQSLLAGLHADNGCPWYTGDLTGEWDEEGARELELFQKQNGLIPKQEVDARFGAKMFHLLHEAAGKPKAGPVVVLASDAPPNLPDQTTLELYFWIRGKSPTLAEYRNSAQSVRDAMDKSVIQELTNEGEGGSK